MNTSTVALDYARNNHSRYLSDLREFLAIPSISTLSEHKADMQRAAEWVAAQLHAMNFQNVALLPTGGHPVVYGERLSAPGKPTVLIYGHYDVQPVDPLDEWKSPPFEATIRGDDLFARGASDMKGQVHAFLKALEALIQADALNLNIKVMVEGEEEIGSVHLAPFLQEHEEKLKCDVCLNADSQIVSPEQPSIVYGLRGLAYLELVVYGPEHDLHSGIFGGSLRNPAQVLCELIAGMHDANGRVTLPGFYDNVRELTEEERAELARFPLSDEEWKKTAGVADLYGEQGFSTTERVGARPTLEVNGILSGFTGEGSKTVLPAKAMAKISTRLVPYQAAHAVKSQLEEYLRQYAPATVRWQVIEHTSSPAVLVDRDSDFIRAALAALDESFGVKPVFQLLGFSVPVVSMIQKILGVESVLMGFGLSDDNLHAPNEKLHLPNYFRGIESYIRFFENAGALRP